jgi:DNA-binding response OmpR family regulator
MLTSKAQEKNIVRALEAGADDYIVKPFQPEELVARVRRFVREK